LSGSLEVGANPKRRSLAQVNADPVCQLRVAANTSAPPIGSTRAFVWYNERVDYQLAQELRDAGFPQTGRGTQIGPSDKLVWRAGDRVYIPTLSELIEACGERFWMLEACNLEAGNWHASGYAAAKIEGAYGTSPDEAVARLWLVLNKT
jgi:hypothetical protein